MNETLNSGRKETLIISILVFFLLGGVAFLFLARSGPKPAKDQEAINTPGNARAALNEGLNAGSAPIAAARPKWVQGLGSLVTSKKAESLAAQKKTTPLESPKVSKNVLTSAITEVRKVISAGLAATPPKAVTNLATKPASEGGRWCPAPGCPCGKDCIYTDTNLPVITKNQDGSWNLKCSGVMDSNGKTTPLTSVYKWDRGNLAMVSEFQAAE